jgi:curved DNA-binding protein CbpA
VKLTEYGACQILGLGAPTTLADARKSYRALARELHPDVGGDEERFKQVAEAYQFLV